MQFVNDKYATNDLGKMQTPSGQQKYKSHPISSNSFCEHNLSGSETDTSNENLSMEQRYVLRNTPRIEPQGEEDFPETLSVGTENSSE